MKVWKNLNEFELNEEMKKLVEEQKRLLELADKVIAKHYELKGREKVLNYKIKLLEAREKWN